MASIALSIQDRGCLGLYPNKAKAPTGSGPGALLGRGHCAIGIRGDGAAAPVDKTLSDPSGRGRAAAEARLSLQIRAVALPGNTSSSVGQACESY